MNGGDRRSYIIGNLDPYKAYVIEIQAFTRAGVSPTGKAKDEVQTHEDGRFIKTEVPKYLLIVFLLNKKIEWIEWKRRIERNRLERKGME